MNVLVTGGTGYIGARIIAALRAGGHRTLALARSAAAANRLRAAGSEPVAGELANARDWLRRLAPVDAVIHTAATFGDDMADADAAFIDALLAWLPGASARRGTPLPIVLTGGLWLYGPVGDDAAIEGAPFDPPAEFAWMVEHRRRVFACPDAAARIVHPAMVWDDTEGGVVQPFLERAAAGRAPCVIGSPAVRWPVVHADDLARLYTLALEQGDSGADYHGVAENGVPVGEIAAAIARCYGAPRPLVWPVEAAIDARGRWAACFAYDQTMDAPRTRAALGWYPARPGILASLSARQNRRGGKPSPLPRHP